MRPVTVLACALISSSISGCVDDPSTANPISLTPSMTSVPADGATIIMLQLSAVSDQAVTLTASTGAFVDAPAPASGALSTLSVMTARGSATINYQAGLSTGTAVITASAGPYTIATNVTLTESAPAQVVLTPNRTSVTGDGVSYVELQTDVLAAETPALVSLGTALEYGVCCGTIGLTTDCPAGTSPLAIPTIERITGGQQVVVRAVTVKVTAATPAVLIARVQNASFTESLCATAHTGEVRSNPIAVTVTP